MVKDYISLKSSCITWTISKLQLSGMNSTETSLKTERINRFSSDWRECLRQILQLNLARIASLCKKSAILKRTRLDISEK